MAQSSLHSSQDTITAGWTKEYDEHYKAYYYYDSITGESKWADEFEPAGGNIAGLDHSQQSQEGDSSGTYPVYKKYPDTSSGHHKVRHGVEVKEDADSDPLVQAVPTDQPSQRQLTEFKKDDMVWYTRSVYLNAVLIEAPLCVAESVLRIAIVGIVLFLKVTLLCILRRFNALPGLVISHIRECILTLAAAATLAIPCSICFVYWDYSPDHDWLLRYIPTVLGSVDARRFGVITVFGGGATAANVSKSQLSNGSEVSLDSYPSATLMLPPREVLRDILFFIRGRRTIDSLDVQL